MVFSKTSVIILFALFAVVGFLIGGYNIDETDIKKKEYDTGYSDGYNTAWNKAEKLVDSSPIFPKMPNEMYSISGKIESVSAFDKLIVIEANPVSMNPFSSDSESTVRNVKVNSDTKIVKLKEKTPEEISALTQKGKAPVFFSEEEISFEQLRERDEIIVASDENIKTEKEIVATKISLR